MICFRVLDGSKVFVAFQDGLFVFELQVDGHYKMDVLLVAGVDAAAGDCKGRS